MKEKILTNEELSNIKVGEGITLAAVMAIVAIAICMVIVYKLFKSSKGSAALPGGYKFEWKWSWELMIYQVN